MMKEEMIFDFEADWKIINSNTPDKLIYQNQVRKTFYRVIDIKEQTYRFSDTGRITKYIDINKVLTGESKSDELKKLYLPICNKCLDIVHPIDIPYRPEDLTCYIEAFSGKDVNYEDTLGILYFKDNSNDQMIECKKFFYIHPISKSETRYEEIDFHTYNNLKTDYLRRCEENVDKSSE